MDFFVFLIKAQFHDTDRSITKHHGGLRKHPEADRRIFRKFQYPAGRSQHRPNGESPGWKEPGQQPRFDEYTIVLDGTLRVETRKDDFFVHAGQAFMVGRFTCLEWQTIVARLGISSYF